MAMSTKIRVLIVDDQVLIRVGIQTLLSRKPDIEVVGQAGDGAEALRQVDALDPDVVLMDLRMPGMDGRQTLARLREAPGPNQDIPVMAFTADADIAGEGDLDAFDGVVRKPIAPLEMYATIARATQWTDADDKEETHAAVC
jgi:CheY-like chemotaxis protein